MTTLTSEARRVRILTAATIGILGTATAMALASVWIPVWVLIAVGVGAIDFYWIWAIYRRDRGARAVVDGFSGQGFSVEVDCRGCGQFNRVPSHRLRDRPVCGRCKARLMPRRRVVLCRVTPMNSRLLTELKEVWSDEDRLWQSLADHVALETKATAEAKNPSLHVVN